MPRREHDEAEERPDRPRFEGQIIFKGNFTDEDENWILSEDHSDGE